MTNLPERIEIVSMIDEAVKNGARQVPSCKIIGLSCRTYQRWKSAIDKEDGRPMAQHTPPANKLTETQRADILATCHSPEYQSCPPSQIVPDLADHGKYMGSESTFYRILQEANEKNHRGRSRMPKKHGPPRSHTANRPCQVWTWDVTWLKGPVKGIFFYLYMIIDVYSRKIVGWEVWEKESAKNAKLLIERAVLKENCKGVLEVLHADNGSIQRASTLRIKLDTMDIEASYSRPRVSNDNAFSESLFRTFKYRPDFPTKGFSTVSDARRWVFHFVEWYNNHHLHSGNRFISPVNKHTGEDIEILAKRTAVYEEAKLKNPNRWTGKIRCWDPIKEVFLNKPIENKCTLNQV